MLVLRETNNNVIKIYTNKESFIFFLFAIKNKNSKVKNLQKFANIRIFYGEEGRKCSLFICVNDICTFGHFLVS